ncbi:hypothetical protein POI8812_01753 [Pontivivens insulae]|uniref:DUF1697 domain-containing protein n=2 Tax=Pontivivens insulae TaxID=1639689 RepID=A0A2R8AB40_9RHOB|nr:hypothetical protein POI8812_01753 [Pontivivens insulae]
MAALKRAAIACDLTDVETYLATGNLLFQSDLKSDDVKSRLAQELEQVMGDSPALFIRTHADLTNLAAANPFSDLPGNKVMALLLDDPVEPGAIRHQTIERVEPGPGALFIGYPEGMGRSRMIVEAQARGTARNLNTISKLVEKSAA